MDYVNIPEQNNGLTG